MKIFAKIMLLFAALCCSQTILAAPALDRPLCATQNIQERILWGTPISPYVRPVLITLYEKNLSFTHHKIFPTVILQAVGQAIPEDFKSGSPFGKIPFYEELLQNGQRFGLSESAIIMDYIDASNRPYLLAYYQKVTSRNSFKKALP